MTAVTMQDIKAMQADFITPKTAAEALHMDPGRLIHYAKDGQLPFPVQISGKRVKISRIGFLAAYGYADPEEEKPTMEQLMAKIVDRLAEIEELLKRRIAG